MMCEEREVEEGRGAGQNDVILEGPPGATNAWGVGGEGNLRGGDVCLNCV
jgi:hypothetical protein